MPQLKHLSVFIQGPLIMQYTYNDILSVLNAIQLSNPKCFVVRFPWPVDADIDQKEAIDQMMEDRSLPFQLVRPEHREGTDKDKRIPDLDTGHDLGWREGVLFSPVHDGSGEFTTKSYSVFTPLPT